MSVQAQNALLKVLEEPPDYALFLLTCPSAYSLLPTVRSRAQVVTLTPPSEEEAVAAALEKCPQVSRQEMESAARQYGCNVGKMIASFSEEAQAAAADLAAAIVESSWAPQELPLLEMTAPMLRDRNLIRAVMGHLVLIFRDACAIRAGSAVCISGSPRAQEASRKLAGRLTRIRLMQLPALAEETRLRVDRNANTSLLVTEFCAQLRELAGQ